MGRSRVASQKPARTSLLRAPVNVTWEISGTCNLACVHCLSADVSRESGEDLDFDQCTRLIDEFDKLKIFQINFGGGEPFLRDDFIDLLYYTHHKGITTCVSTNGTMLDEKIVKRLKRMDLLYVQISLDGASEETNDRIRGKGTFKQILSGIKLLSKHQFPNFSINTVVTRLNFREIGQLHALAREHGAKTRLSRFRPSGRGKEAWDEYRLDTDRLAALSMYLRAHGDVLTGDSFFSIAPRDRRGQGMNMCGAARMTCSISPGGDVYPCAFLHDVPFKAGNVKNDLFGSIWRDSASFNMIRSIRIEACERCSRFDMCHGGCPAVAYFLTRTLNHSDPECLATFQTRFSLNEQIREVKQYAGTI